MLLALHKNVSSAFKMVCCVPRGIILRISPIALNLFLCLPADSDENQGNYDYNIIRRRIYENYGIETTN